MKRLLSILLILAVPFIFSSCRNDSNASLNKDNKVKSVTTEEAHELLSSKNNLVILDVRTEGEYKGGHIKGAILMPSTELDLNIEQITKFKDNPVLVYCRTGRRSADAINILSKYGFKNIYHMYQGISAWKYDLEK